jgi:hypothetical protein
VQKNLKRDKDASMGEAPPSDPYEARYMEGGAALARAKKRMPGWFFALLALAGLAGPIATLASGAPLLPALLPSLLSLVAVSLVGVPSPWSCERARCRPPRGT